ncbi:DUF6056 family protein [Liquorilactobacillus hordei]|uniref:DUF3329 domain-containing protein n=1 Tax=Liquorilactobacillus hordei TaxID=468911 RepID=UPI0039E91735
MFKKINRNKLLFFGLQILLGIIMSLWIYSTPLWDDDFEPARYLNVWQMLLQTKADYFNWNGRIVGQTLFRFLASGNQIIVSILDGFMFVLLTVLVYMLSVGRKHKTINNLGYISVLLALMISIPVFGQTILWRAGAGNYLWVTTINLLFVTLYTNDNYLETSKPITKSIQVFIFVILALLSGLGGENTSGGTILFLLIYSVYNYKKYKKINIYKIIGMASLVIGYIVLILAPGAKIRTIAGMGKEYYDTPLIMRIIKGLYQVNSTINHFYVPLILLTVLLGVWTYNHRDSKLSFAYGITWILSGYAIIYALSFSPMGQDGGRPFFGGIIYILIGLFNLAPTDDDFTIGKGTTYIKQLAITGILISSFVLLPNGFYDSLKASKAINMRYTYIERNAKKANEDKKIIQVPPLSYYPQTKYSVNYQLEDIKFGENSWPNNLYDSFFKIRGITLPN